MPTSTAAGRPLVYGLVLAAVLTLLAAVASGFGDPIGLVVVGAGDSGFFDRLRIVAGSVNPIYVLLAAFAVTLFAGDQPGRVPAVIGGLAVVQLLLVVYVFVFDAATGAGRVRALDTFVEILFEGATLALTLAVVLWARAARRPS